MQNENTETIATETAPAPAPAVVRVHQMAPADALAAALVVATAIMSEAVEAADAVYQAALVDGTATMTAAVTKAAAGRKSDIPTAMGEAMAAHAAHNAAALAVRDQAVSSANDAKSATMASQRAYHAVASVKPADLGLSGTGPVQKTRFLKLIETCKVPVPAGKSVVLSTCQLEALVARAAIEGWLRKPSHGKAAKAFARKCHGLASVPNAKLVQWNVSVDARVMTNERGGRIHNVTLEEGGETIGDNISPLLVMIVGRLSTMPVESIQARVDAILRPYVPGENSAPSGGKSSQAPSES